MVFIGGFSGFVQKPDIVMSCGFLCCVQCIKTLLLTYQKLFLDYLSNFSSLGETFVILGGQKVTQHGKKGPKKFPFFSSLNQDAKWNKKMGGRSFVITCGVIGTLYTLQYSTETEYRDYMEQKSGGDI